MRLRRAAQWLEEDGRPVQTVAGLVGYEKAFAFSRAFRRHMGRSPIDDPVVHRAMELINDRAADGLGVPGLLRALGVGRRQLEQRFRASLGSSPHAEIRRRWVETARELLDRSDLDLESIAEATGFGSASRLSVVFKQLTGNSPGAWRRSISAHLDH